MPDDADADRSPFDPDLLAATPCLRCGDHHHHEDDEASEHLPLRLLPTNAELAEQVRAHPYLTELARFARWLGSGRPIEPKTLRLSQSDVDEATAEFGEWIVDLPQDDHWRAVKSRMDPSFDVEPDASTLLPTRLAMVLTVGFAEIDDDLIRRTALAESWPDVTTDEATSAWDALFMFGFHPALSPPDPENPVSLLMASGFRLAMNALMTLYAAPEERPLDDLFASLEEPPRDGPLAHDPETGRMLAATMAASVQSPFVHLKAIGAIESDSGGLGDLGASTVVRNAEVFGVEAPTLHSINDADVEDLVELCTHTAADRSEALTTEWVDGRGTMYALAELAAALRRGPVSSRPAVLKIMSSIRPEAVQVVRDLLEDPDLRPYAITWLRIWGSDDDRQLELSAAEAQYYLIDRMAGVLIDYEPDDLDSIPDDGLRDEVAGLTATDLDSMWRCEHDRTADVLTFIGDQHHDRKLAKAARKAAFKANGRR